jgi:hypothetical protein
MRLTMNKQELAHLVVERIWNGGELELADALFSEDYVNHGGLISDLFRGPEVIKLSVVLFRSAFPGFYIAVDGVATDGEATELRWTAYRRPPKNRRNDYKNGLRGITRFRMAGGQIAESWTAWDSRVGLVRLRTVNEAAGTPRWGPLRASKGRDRMIPGAPDEATAV